MNEGTRPELPKVSTFVAEPGAALRWEAIAASTVPVRPPPPVSGLRAADLVVEMLQTALDDLAAAPPPGARVASAAPTPAAAAARPEHRREMSTPLDPAPLVALQGADFVRHAYLELLGREPDERASFYTAALLEGRLTKFEILGGIRFSDEGKAVGREVLGLRPRVLLSRAYRVPVVGRLLRIGAAVAGLPALLRHLQRLEQGFAGATARTDSLLAASEAEGRARAAAGAAVRARVQALEKALAGLPDARALVTEAVARQADRDGLTDDAVVSLADRLDALEAAVSGAGERLVTEGGRAPGADDHSLDDLYLAFEDKFRGARGLIKERQSVHLPVLRDCGAGAPERPVLDVGCGRGEWLELLRDHGLAARGVDLNASMVELCRGLELEAAAGDAVEHLRALPAGSLGAVTGFHIIEHLPFEVFVRLLDESLRALASGGAILFETPNPDNVLVGSRNFYLDPTHRNPLPKELPVMIAEARGFARAHARDLHPTGVSFNAKDKALGERLDGLFYGPQDYALVAWKP
uniref:methyltransferase domain-containing protein n=1 Tax=uncultured Sphingomonas sp. TaxID=158754 RepID=UPI0025FF9811|nr:methyltransferase domain-containing protein [uncultured Sphingomonas sp.]